MKVLHICHCSAYIWWSFHLPRCLYRIGVRVNVHEYRQNLPHDVCALPQFVLLVSAHALWRESTDNIVDRSIVWNGTHCTFVCCDVKLREFEESPTDS